MFENFRAINLTAGYPTVSITDNGVSYSKTAISKLDYPSHVKILLDENGKQFAIQVCDKSDPNATAFAKNREAQFVRWNNGEFTKTLRKIIAGNSDAHGYRIDGEYISSENALLFDLKKYTIIEKKMK